jgi:flagellar motor switch protein FliG
MTTPFRFLEDADNESLLGILSEERPQTIALIMSYMLPAQAAYIIEGLPPERILAVLRRLASMRTVELAVVTMIELELADILASTSQEFVKRGGVDKVAEILGAVEPSTRSNTLENLSVDAPELVAEIEKSATMLATLCRLEQSGRITIRKQ